jgi:hypothetical protein
MQHITLQTHAAAVWHSRLAVLLIFMLCSMLPALLLHVFSPRAAAACCQQLLHQQPSTSAAPPQDGSSPK